MSYSVTLPLADCIAEDRVDAVRARFHPTIEAFMASRPETRWQQLGSVGCIGGPVRFTFDALSDAILFKLTFGGT